MNLFQTYVLSDEDTKEGITRRITRYKAIFRNDAKGEINT